MGSHGRRAGALLAATLMAACNAAAPEPLDHVPLGTWGGEDAGLLVSESGAHLHIGCTVGDVSGLIPLDAQHHFDVAGTYDVDAFPIDRGILHPARFRGSTDGRSLIVEVTLSDDGRRYGPATVFRGRPPGMTNCPICRPRP